MTFDVLASGTRPGGQHWRTLASRIGLGVALGASVLFAWWLADQVVRGAEEAAREAALQRATATAAAADQFANHVLHETRALHAMARRWQELDGAADEARRDEVERAIHAALTDHPGTPIAHVAVLRADGSLAWQSAPAPPTPAPADAAPATGGALRLEPPQPDAGPGGARIAVTRGLTSPGGEAAGTAIVTLLAAPVAEVLASLLRFPTDLLMLLRMEGEALATAGQTQGPVALPPALRARLAREPVLAFATASPLEDGRALVALRRVRGTNIVVLSAADPAASLAPVHALGLLAETAAGVYTALVALGLLLGFGTVRARRLRREAAMLRAGRAEVERLQGKLPVVIFLREVAADGSSRLVYRAGDVAAVTGWPPGALDARPDWSALVAPGSDNFIAGLDAALAHGSAELRWRMRQPDGSFRPMVSRLERLSRAADGSGEVVGYIRDVSAEDQAARRAEDARQELDSTLANAPVAVLRAEIWPDGRYRKTYLSRGIERMTGRSAEEIALAGGLPQVLEPWSRMREGIAAVLRDGEWSGDFHVTHSDGRHFVVRLTTRVTEALPEGGATIVGYIADITAERHAEARAIAAARLASLGEMSAGLAHELKQPLQAIALAANNAQVALGRGDRDAAAARMDRIVAYARRAGSVIENLRRFARGADSGAPPGPMALDEAVAGALSVVGATLRDSEVTVAVEMPSPAPVALGHLVSLEQVLTNLLLNARDAMTVLPPGAARRITIRAEPAATAGHVQLTVADTGGGLPPEILDHLFEPFVTTKGPERGTGLGLSICHGLVREMGGSITASNEGPGAVFRILLADSAPLPA